MKDFSKKINLTFSYLYLNEARKLSRADKNRSGKNEIKILSTLEGITKSLKKLGKSEKNAGIIN